MLALLLAACWPVGRPAPPAAPRADVPPPVAAPTAGDRSWPTAGPRGGYSCQANGDWRTYLGDWDGTRYARELPQPAWWPDGLQPNGYCGDSYHFARAAALDLHDTPLEIAWLPRTGDSVEIHPLLDRGQETWERSGIVTVTHHHLTVPASIRLLVVEDGRLALQTAEDTVLESFPVRAGHRYAIAVTAGARGFPFFEVEDGLGPNRVAFTEQPWPFPVYWFAGPASGDMALGPGTYAIDSRTPVRRVRIVIPFGTPAPVSVELPDGARVLRPGDEAVCVEGCLPLTLAATGPAQVHVELDVPLTQSPEPDGRIRLAYMAENRFGSGLRPLNAGTAGDRAQLAQLAGLLAAVQPLADPGVDGFPFGVPGGASPVLHAIYADLSITHMSTLPVGMSRGAPCCSGVAGSQSMGGSLRFLTL